jgi:hypothetical protein
VNRVGRIVLERSAEPTQLSTEEDGASGRRQAAEAMAGGAVRVAVSLSAGGAPTGTGRCHAAAAPTAGRLNRPLIEPRKCAAPKAKTPPSEPTNT